MHTRRYAYDERWDPADMERIAKSLAIRICTLHGWDANKAVIEVHPNAIAGERTPPDTSVAHKHLLGRVTITYDDTGNPWDVARKRFDDSEMPQLIEG